MGGEVSKNGVELSNHVTFEDNILWHDSKDARTRIKAITYSVHDRNEDQSD